MQSGSLTFQKKKKFIVSQMSVIPIVDFNAFKSFCLRGEGSSNLLIGATRRIDEIRIVWRFMKTKTGHIDTNQKAHLKHYYHENFVRPFVDNAFLIRTRLVRIKEHDLHHLAKIPSLPRNSKMEKFAELCDESKYSAAKSLFPFVNTINSHGHFIFTLEMQDATILPYSVSSPCGPNITVELKPMQGAGRVLPAKGVATRYCRRCVFQIEKSFYSADFVANIVCPLSIYSGHPDRMGTALSTLFRRPGQKLRIFVDGNVVHDGKSPLPANVFIHKLFPKGNVDMDTFIHIICCLLTGRSADQPEPGLKQGCVLGAVLDAQRINNVGLCEAHRNYQQLDPSVKRQLQSNTHWLDGALAELEFLRQHDPRSLVQRYLLGDTFSHCSIMMNLQMVNGFESNNNNPDFGAVAISDGRAQIRGKDGHPLYLAFSIRIVDTDPRCADTLEDKYRRYIAGLDMLRADPDLRQPCTFLNH